MVWNKEVFRNVAISQEKDLVQIDYWDLKEMEVKGIVAERG